MAPCEVQILTRIYDIKGRGGEVGMKEYIIKVDDPGERAWDGGPKVFETKELVRCGECKHHGKDTCSAVGGIAYPPPTSWFCADGERQEGR